MKCLIKIHDEIWCTLVGISATHLDELYNKFGPYIPGYRFMTKFKLGRWDGRVRFVQKNGKTYVKLLEKIIPYLSNWGYELDLDDNRIGYKLPAKIDENIFKEFGIILRPHQVEGTNALLEAGSAIGTLGTGLGKTFLTASLSYAMEQINYRSIIVVPSIDLVNQTYESFINCGLDTGKYCGDEKDINHKHVISTWQSLQNNPFLLSSGDFKCIQWDECHQSAASVAQSLLNDYGKEIPYRFAVTGTFPKEESSQLAIHSAFGDIVYKMTTRQAMDLGYLTPVEIEVIMFKEKIKEEFPDYTAEKNYLIKSDGRIDVLADLIINRCDMYGNTLVLVNSVSFGKKLASMIEGAVFLHGDTKTDIRKEHYDLFEVENGLIRIATFGIASTGISINRVFNLMMIDAGKGFTKTIQSIGRSLRLAEDKDIAHVCDVYSNLKWSKKHAKEREKFYKEAEYPVVQKIEIKI